MSRSNLHAVTSPHRRRAAIATVAPAARLVTALLACAVLLPGCSDDPVEAPSVENFARAWHLTSCEYRKAADDAVRVDLVAEGWTMDLYINDNGRFHYAWTPPVGVPGSYGGTWTVDGQTVSLKRDGAGFSWSFRAEVREESMTLRGAQAEYDFAGNGTPEAATWNLAGDN
ncbi:hypothetical protein FJ250_07070 [bacterium]|nr:hypothetical protein [bacterium]